MIANYLLMMTWFPACLIIWENSCFSNPEIFGNFYICYHRWCCPLIPWNMVSRSHWRNCKTVWMNKEKFLFDTIFKLRYIWFILLLLIAVGSGCVVFVYPKLQLPDTTEFQLFSSSHPFEQYDFVYRRMFWFNSAERVSIYKFYFVL